MNKSGFSLVAAMFAAGSILSSCSSDEKKMENAEQSVQDSKEDVKVAKDNLEQAQKDADNDFQTFKTESNNEIIENEKRIAELRGEMKNEKKDIRESDEKKIDALEKQNREMKEKLEAFKDDGKSDWKEFKKEFKHDMDGLGNAFKDITVRNTK